jgi:hypothetical protein
VSGSLLCYTLTLQQSGFHKLELPTTTLWDWLRNGVFSQISLDAFEMIFFLHNWNQFITIWLNFLIHWKHFKWNSAKFTTWHFRSSRSLRNKGFNYAALSNSSCLLGMARLPCPDWDTSFPNAHYINPFQKTSIITSQVMRDTCL